MNVPSLTIITATFNCAKDLPTLLRSLRNQTDREFDLVMVDGGSTDTTLDIANRNGDIVTLLLNGPDLGIYDAINKGILAARSTHYLVVGGDDTLSPTAVADYKDILNRSGADIVVASVKASGSVRTGYKPHRAWLGHAAMITSHSVGMAIRTSLHERFGLYNLNYSIVADGLFIKRACLAPDIKVVEGDFMAGAFGTEGASNKHVARALFETWQLQIATGERPTTQYFLYIYRLLKFFPRILPPRLPR